MRKQVEQVKSSYSKLLLGRAVWYIHPHYSKFFFTTLRYLIKRQYLQEQFPLDQHQLIISWEKEGSTICCMAQQHSSAPFSTTFLPGQQVWVWWQSEVTLEKMKKQWNDCQNFLLIRSEPSSQWEGTHWWQNPPNLAQFSSALQPQCLLNF